MGATVISVRTREKNKCTVILEIMAGNEKRKYTVNEGTYRNIGCPLSGEEIDEDMMLTVSEEDGRRRALEKALKILAYADNNEKTLYMKLIRQSFSPAEASFATEECVRLGYINEERQIENAVRSAYSRLEGPYKITVRLARRGYQPKAVRAVIDAMVESGEIDFKAQRARLMREKLPDGASTEETKKLLHRYGYIK